MSAEEQRARLDYEGRDLEAMAVAENYHRWIADLFAPFLGQCVVELGAGSGNFSSFLVDKTEDSAQVTLIEPSPDMFRLLQHRFRHDGRVRCLQHTLETAAAEGQLGVMDTFVAVNVLEHIEHDRETIHRVADLLKPAGALCLFVPALPALYSRADAEVGHFRRYTAKSLAGVVLSDSRLRIVSSCYVDLLGVLPWWIVMRLFRGSLSPANVGIYDKIGVPLTRAMERIWSPPIGKNLCLVARRI